jgi:NAD(P)-dependent dehydrogenase (short-subunit alcohol dehydrogenase family)
VRLRVELRQLSKPVAVVTGGAGAVGIASCRRLAGAHTVVLADIGRERVDAALSECAKEGVEVVGVVCDVTDERSVAELVEAAGAAGELRVLVHTVGIFPFMADAARVFDVNYVGACRVVDAFLPLAGDGTAAICIASVSGHRRTLPPYDHVFLEQEPATVWERLVRLLPIGDSPAAAYSFSKRGVLLLAEERAHAWGDRGARITTVSPGNVASAPGIAALDLGAQMLVDAASTKRAAKPDEVAAAAQFLWSEDARYITGCDLRVDGGTIANLNHHPASLELREAFHRLW